MDQYLQSVPTSWCSIGLSLLGAGFVAAFAILTMLKSRATIRMVVDSQDQSLPVPVSSPKSKFPKIVIA
jgi:hypothetical protein